MKRFKTLFLTIAFVGALSFSFLPSNVAVAQTDQNNQSTQNAQNNKKCTSSFLTFPTWWRGLNVQGDCSVQMHDSLEKTVSIILLNVVEIIIQLVGYTCVIFMLTGGFYYMTSAGSPDLATRGLKTIRNAAIGLVISLTSVGIVNLVASSLR